MFVFGKNKKKNLLVFFLALFVAGGALFASADVPSASAAEPCGFWDLSLRCGAAAMGVVGDLAVDAAAYPFKLLLYGVFIMFGWIASLAITIFEWIIQPQYVTMLFNSPGVYESWRFVRDFLNLFFIFALLYIAFTVVFQVQKNFKQALLGLVLAALLVNFSFPISRALIDVTNVPMYFFSNQMMARGVASGTGVFGATLTASNIKGILIPPETSLGSTDMSRLLVAVVFIFLFAITLLVLAVMFVIRLVALVVLVIFSPVGFVASIIPGMEQYSKMWWDNFWKYAIFGPAAMLMLLVATRFFAEIGDVNGPLLAGLQTVAGNNVMGVDRDFFASMALFTIPIIMLWMAMGLAQKMSIAGASSVVGLGQKVSKWTGGLPFRAGWTGAKWAGRKYERKMTDGKENKYAQYTKWLAPSAIGHAWEEWRKENHEQDKAPVERAAGSMQDAFNVAFGQHSNHAFRVMQQQSAKKAKELLDISQNSAYLINELDHALGNGESELVRGAMQALLKTNNLNDLMAASQGKAYGKGLATEKYIGKDGKEKEAVVISSKNYKVMMENLLSQAGMNPESQEAAMEGMAMGETGLAAGNAALFGMYHYNDKDKKWKKSTSAEQAAMVDAKMRNLEPQVRQRMNHPDTTFKYYYNEDGERHILDLNDEVGIASLQSYKGGDVDNAGRSREDFRGGIYEVDKMRTDAEANVPGVKKPELYLQALQQNDVLPRYVAKVRSGYEGEGKNKEEKPKASGGTGEPQPKAGGEAPQESPAEKNARNRSERMARAEEFKRNDRR